MNETALIQESAAFSHYLAGWINSLPVLRWPQVMPDPVRTAILSVDVIKGFCIRGPLASERVNRIVEPVVHLFQGSYQLGLRNIVLIQDTHEPEAVEFSAWPVHCVRGSDESEPVDAFQALPFFNDLVIFPKNSISSDLNTGLPAWQASHPMVDTYLVVGDCTDLCTYQLALQLRLDANAHQLQRRVIVPANCSETYDRPIEVAQTQGGLPHPGDLLHALFLYHMALNGVEVAAKVE